MSKAKANTTVGDKQDFVVLPLNSKDIRNIYSSPNSLDLRDIVVAVRLQYPDPRQKVCLQTSLRVSSDLHTHFIFHENQQEEVAEFRVLSSKCYCAVDLDKFECIAPNELGAQVTTYVNSFCIDYDIARVTVLPVTNSEEVLLAFWEYIRSSIQYNFTVDFPLSLHNAVKINQETDIDLDPYTKVFYLRSKENALNTELLFMTMEKLRSEVKSGKRSVRALEGYHSTYTAWLTACLTYEFDLLPAYMITYLRDYISLEIAYPLNKLSLTERYNFVRALPEGKIPVGFIGSHCDFTAVFFIQKKIYPKPYIVYNFTQKTFVLGDLSHFSLEAVDVLDSRMLFPQSQSVFTALKLEGKAEGLSLLNNVLAGLPSTDEEVDRYLFMIFGVLLEHAEKERIYPTIRNTVFAKRRGDPHSDVYLVHFNEPFGVAGILVSPIFGTLNYVLSEENFKSLIDFRFIDVVTGSAQDIQERNNKMNALMMRTRKTFTPALDPYISMCASLSSTVGNSLSYYDKNLRCVSPLLPIFAHRDTEAGKEQNIFSYIPAANILKDAQARNYLTCFGSLKYSDKIQGKLPVSLDSFKGVYLL